MEILCSENGKFPSTKSGNSMLLCSSWNSVLNFPITESRIPEGTATCNFKQGCCLETLLSWNFLLIGYPWDIMVEITWNAWHCITLPTCLFTHKNTLMSIDWTGVGGIFLNRLIAGSDPSGKFAITDDSRYPIRLPYLSQEAGRARLYGEKMDSGF